MNYLPLLYEDSFFIHHKKSFMFRFTTRTCIEEVFKGNRSFQCTDNIHFLLFSLTNPISKLQSVGDSCTKHYNAYMVWEQNQHLFPHMTPLKWVHTFSIHTMLTSTLQNYQSQHTCFSAGTELQELKLNSDICFLSPISPIFPYTFSTHLGANCLSYTICLLSHNPAVLQESSSIPAWGCYLRHWKETELQKKKQKKTIF